MNFLPVAERELRVLARQPRTYTARTLNALVVIVISLGMLYAGFGGLLSAGAAGRNLFVLLAWAAGLYVLLEGALMTADCLSREKRDGTLGLLFLTDLRGYDVVAGKLISRTGSSAYCLLAALPVLGIALFLGGVTGRDFACMILALLNGMFFSASLGMLISAICRRERTALAGAVLGTVSLAIGVPAIGWGVSLYRSLPAIDPLFLASSPAGAFWAALHGGTPGAPLGYSFSASLLLAHVLGWFFLAAASAVLPYSWREPPAPPNPTCPLQPLKSSEGGRASSVMGFWQRNPVEASSIFWAADKAGKGGLGIWPVFVLFIIAWTAGWLFVRSNWLTLPVYAGTAFLLHLTLTFFVLLQACRGPAEDQRNGVLETLLTTPLGQDVYLRGRLLALKRLCVWPLLLVLATDAGLMAAGCWQTGALNWEWLTWVGAFIALVAKLIVDLYTLSWVGFWQGLKVASTSRAIRNTLFYVFLFKWVILLGCLALLGIFTQGYVFQSAAGGAIAVVGYLALLVMTVLHFGGRAMSELHDNLRVLAIQSGGEDQEIWNWQRISTLWRTKDRMRFVQGRAS